MMGKAIIILTIVIVLGMLAKMQITDWAAGSRPDFAYSDFQAGSVSYKAAYAEAGQYYRSKSIDINKANLSQLTEVKGIGPVLAKKIIDYRKKNGYFRTLTELQNISGIGPKLIRQWDSIFVIASDDTINQKGRVIE
ncbi:ComEA family DNA-binding protein [Candidatus Neomarinimicrobiota bacterium]